MKKFVYGFLLMMIGIGIIGCSSNDMDMNESLNNGMYAQNPGSNSGDFMSEGTNESYSDIVENPFIRTEDMAVSTFSADVDTASFSNIRRFLNDGQLPNVNAVRIEEMINYFDYDLSAPEGDAPFGVDMQIGNAPWNAEHQLLMLGLKTEAIDFSETPANNLVFLLDVSGSMNSDDKLPLLKQAMAMLVNELRPQDKISIVVYAGAAGVVLDAADGGDREAILDAINGLNAGGSTAGGAGINLAYQIAMENYIEDGNNRVILGTDGDFNVGVSTTGGLERLIEEKRDSGIFLSVLGFGTGNIQDDKMETLADKGNGVYHYIDSLIEAKKVFVDELGASLVTVAKDVKLQIEFNPIHYKAYRLIGYENRLLNYDDFDDDEVDAGDIGAGHEVVALYELIPADADETVEEQDLSQPDDLKYDGENHPDELLTFKIRYKDPDGDTSELIEHVMETSALEEDTDDDFLLATSLAEFGMLLRDSEYKGNAGYTGLLDRLDPLIGNEEDDPIQMLADLITQAKTLSEQDDTTE